jgi:hypothetical protein
MPNNASVSFPDRNSWLESFGLAPDKDPFQATAAENEEDVLERYFTSVPFFEQMSRPQTTFLFLKRGAGKTASRIMLQKKIQRESSQRALVVSCHSYNELIDKSNITLQDHVDLIMREAVRVLSQNIDFSRSSLDQNLVKNLMMFLKQYPDFFSNQIIRGAITATNFVKAVARDILVTKLGFSHTDKELDELINSTDFSDVPPVEIVRKFGYLAKAFGFERVYIFIDGVDEDAGSDFSEKAVKMLVPFLKTTTLLQLSLFSFKLFLPLEISESLRAEVRFDKLSSYMIGAEWTTKLLHQLLEKRMEVFTNTSEIVGENKSLSRLFEDDGDLRNIVEGELIILAEESPRNLISLIKCIIDEHTGAEAAINETGNLSIVPYISRHTYEIAKAKWEKLCKC